MPCIALCALVLGACGPGPSLWHQITLVAPGCTARNFRQMDGVFPARVVSRGATVSEFERTPARPRAFAQLAAVEVESSNEFGLAVPVAVKTIEVDHSDLDALPAGASDFLTRTQTTGLLVLQGDRIVFERAFGEATTDSRFTSWSMAKSVVSMLVGSALAGGSIRSLDDPVSDYVPFLAGTAYAGVAIRDVLAMASGVAFSEDYDAIFSDIRTTFYRIIFAGSRIEDIVRAQHSGSPPGHASRYRSIDAQVLGLVLEAATGRPLAQLLSERLWIPLGMESDAYWNTDRAGDEGVELSFCCLNARLRDYGRLGRLMASRGVYRGQRVLPEWFVAESVSAQRAFQRPGAIEGTPFGYGYQWWLADGDDGEFMAIGVYGQYVYVDPRADVVIVKTSADTHHRMSDTESLDFFRQIVDTLADEPRLRTAAR